METTSTTCCIVGGGPAGLMLGLLLARSGVDVTVLEKHPDFLRDFRGDTIHPSTLDLIEELGFFPELEQLRHDVVKRLRANVNGLWLTLADLGALRTRQPCIYMMPQWDFLELLARKGVEQPCFRLLRPAEVVGLLTEDGRVTGVTYRAEGEVRRLRADLTVACDGRTSTVRALRGVRPVDLGAPMDVLWFRIPRREADTDETFGLVRGGRALVLVERGSYWQAGYLIPKGDDPHVRSAGLPVFRRELARLAPFLDDGRLDELASWNQVFTLHVQVNHLARWFHPGVLFIGDAAHAMSPIGGVGINLALQDAVAAARLLARPLRQGRVRQCHLARVQLRRALPAALTQAFQLLVQRQVIRPVLHDKSERPPTYAARLLGPRVQALAARAIGFGVCPEHWTPPRGTPVR